MMPLLKIQSQNINQYKYNINPVKILDDFMKDILKDKKEQKDLNFDNVLEKNQGRNQ